MNTASLRHETTQMAAAHNHGYFDAEGSPHYYITDWQGNNAAVVNSSGAVVQDTDYYPYGEPTVEPSGQRYLFGGKEREHAAGRNTYDFGARSLTPYGFWSTPDPLAHKFYPISPYSYCGGDPINYIDPKGELKVYLSDHKELNKNTYRYPYDNKINIFAHGNPTFIYYKKGERKIKIKTAKALKKAILENLYQSENRLDESGVEIVLHSCNTGLDAENNELPIAQKLSKEMPNAIIKAPNGYLKIDKNGKETVYNENNQKREKDNSWNIYFRGYKVSISDVELIKEYLLEIEKKKQEQENPNKDETGNH